MKTRSILLVVLLTVVALFTGCEGKNINLQPSSADAVSVSFQPLTTTVNGVQFCASGTIAITGPTTTSFPTTCAQASHEVILLPGSYTATISGLDCTGSGLPPAPSGL